MVVATAQAKNIFVPARKLRLVADLIRSKPIAVAKDILNVVAKKGAQLVIMPLLDSAVANAVNNQGLDADSLVVKTIFVNEGKTLKRFRPGGHGRAFPRLKRTSHVTLIVSTKDKQAQQHV